MSVYLSITEDQTLTALRAFLLSVLPAGVEVVQAQTNRVAEPSSDDFVTMTPGVQERLSTNIDGYADALFIGAISGNTLTVSGVEYGALTLGGIVQGASVAANTTIVAFGTGTGGIGTYTVSGGPQTVASAFLSAGVSTKLKSLKLAVQLDIHGPNSADNALVIETLFRDEYAFYQFQSSGFDVTPLYMSDPRQLPFVNDAQQVEQRWVVDALMQTNPVVSVPQQFATALGPALIHDVI